MDLNVNTLLQKPAYQALFFLLLTPLLLVVTQIKSADKAWSLAVFVFFVFMISNASLLWWAASPWPYFFVSIGVAVAYVLLMGSVLPSLLEVLRIHGSGESAMAFLVVMYHPFLLLGVMVVKWMVSKWML